jgi:hypothetical protein
MQYIKIALLLCLIGLALGSVAEYNVRPSYKPFTIKRGLNKKGLNKRGLIKQGLIKREDVQRFKDLVEYLN